MGQEHDWQLCFLILSCVVGGLPCQSYVRYAVWPGRQNSMGKFTYLSENKFTTRQGCWKLFHQQSTWLMMSTYVSIAEFPYMLWRDWMDFIFRSFFIWSDIFKCSTQKDCWLCTDVCSDCSMKAACITVRYWSAISRRVLHSHIKMYVLPMIKSFFAWRWPKLLLTHTFITDSLSDLCALCHVPRCSLVE